MANRADGLRDSEERSTDPPIEAETGSRRIRAAARRRGGGLRRVLTIPIAMVGAVAVTLGIVQPADAVPQTAKRQAKARASTAGEKRVAAIAAVSAPAEVTVAEGDTISGIAERYGLATAEVLAANGLGWSSLIFPGQRLALPGGTPPAAEEPPPAPDLARHTVVAGDTISGIAERYGVDVAQVLSANGLGRSSLIFPGESIVIPPAGAVASAPAPQPAPEPAPAPEPVAATPVAETAPAPQPAPAPSPAPDRPATLTDEMRQNAQLIIDVGRSTGVPDGGILAALVAAAQESGLRNVPSGDRDSLGLFQQRPSQGWGTPEEVVDPARAARAFYGGPDGPNVGRAPGLLDLKGWQDMPADVAAQAVQKSAHPEHYAKWVSAARVWLADLG